MKVKFLLNFIFIVITQCCFAQITLTSSDFPGAGESWTEHYDANPGVLMVLTSPSPTPQVWDYSAAFNPIISLTVNFTSPASTPGFSYFPASELVSGQGLNDYWIKSSDGFYRIGSYSEDTGKTQATYYSNDFLMPGNFSYDSSRTVTEKEEIITVFKNHSQPATRHIYIRALSYICDSYGTIKTPVYSNPVSALRIVRRETSSVDSLFNDSTGTGNGSYAYISSSQYGASQDDSYWFYKKGAPTAVMYIDNNSYTNTAMWAGYFDSTSVSTGIITHEENPNPLVYPNPCSQSSTIHFTNRDNSAYVIYIYNTMGKLVRELNMEEVNMLSIPASFFKPDTYFFRTTTKAGVTLFTGKFIVLE